MAEPAVDIDQLTFSWGKSNSAIRVPKLSLERGERIFIKGPSGSGKSTLLSLLGGILRPTEGTIRVLGTDLCRLGAGAVDRFRADHTGFIFQQFNLLPYLSLADNVMLPCRFSKRRKRKVESQYGSVEAGARALLAQLGLPESEFSGRSTLTLSVGQQQRVAAARALLGSPELIIADEPTSALDADYRDRFVELLSTECAEVGSTLIFVSHDSALQKHFHRVEALKPCDQGGFRL